MSLRHKDYFEYGREASELLDATVAKLRDIPFEVALAQGLFLFSYVMEDFRAKATKNQDVFDKVGVMLIEMQDVLRATLHGQRALSPVILGTLARVALELRCNLRFIFQSTDPLLYADRFLRFGEFLVYRHDYFKPPERKKLTPERRDLIQQLCPEWLDNGKPRRDVNFTAEPQFRNLRLVAKAVGLEEHYELAYTTFSQFVHGSALLLNAYSDKDGSVGALGSPARCKSMALLAAGFCMETLYDAALFFDVPLDRVAFDAWQERIARASPETGVGIGPRPRSEKGE